jgi:hypothetical protein
MFDDWWGCSMNDRRLISIGCMRLLAEWVRDYLGSDSDPRHGVFLKGMYIIVDDEIREMVERERTRMVEDLQKPARN